METEGVRLVRSVLFTPGTRGDRITKALADGAADVLVADLEDAVAPEEKAAARDTVRKALQDATGRTQRWVRVNTVASGLVPADLEGVLATAPHAIVLPKAQRVADVVALDAMLTAAEKAHGFPPSGIRIVPILETAKGVLDARRIAAASSRVSALMFGAEDLAADAGLRRTRSNLEVLYARSHVALAAAEAGVDAIDQVFVDLDDVKGIEREAHEARALGYRGKMVLHPKQIAPVHAAFAPRADEIDRAKRLITAVRSDGVGAGGVLRFEGRMVDVPLIGQARRLLAEARAMGLDA